MSEYILKSDITSYCYPSHMKRPTHEFSENMFQQWIPKWQTYLGHLSDQPNVTGIEIGVLHGDCSVFCAEKIANGPNSIHYAIDIDENEFLMNNISPFPNIKFLKGYSHDVLRREFLQPNIADYIYIDGSHLAIDVLQDAVLSYYLLKDNGILIFDDYGWGIHTTDETQKPKLGIDSFLSGYMGYFHVLEMGWQVICKKRPIQTTYNKKTEQIERICLD